VYFGSQCRGQRAPSRVAPPRTSKVTTAPNPGQVGAWFTGHNELPDRTWETRSRIEVADRGREFAWLVGGRYARWGFTFAPDGAATRLTERWDFLPDGITMFGEKYGDRAATEIEDRTRQAQDGIPRTLAAIKRIAESA
jgi:hypothetical protein